MRDAVDGAGLNGHVNQIYFKNKPGNQGNNNKKNNAIKTAPGVVAEVKNKM